MERFIGFYGKMRRIFHARSALRRGRGWDEE